MAVLTGSKYGDTLVVTHGYPRSRWFWGAARLLLGWTFLWAFLDKLFGFGFATQRGDAWIRGGSPSTGFLDFETAIPFEGFFRDVLDSAILDWVFMVGLALIGISLILGVCVRIAAWTGAALLVLLYISAFPPTHNPVVDGHVLTETPDAAFRAGRQNDVPLMAGWTSAETKWIRQSLSEFQAERDRMFPGHEQEAARLAGEITEKSRALHLARRLAARYKQSPRDRTED